jgi:hypothetical protein
MLEERRQPGWAWEAAQRKDYAIWCRKWRLVSHADSISPFPEASFINFCAHLSLKDVTEGGITFAEWKGGPPPPTPDPLTPLWFPTP